MNKQQRINNRMLTFFFGIVIIAGNLIAQPQQREKRPPMLPDSTRIVQMVDELTTTLSLSEQQKTKVSELHFTHFAEAKEKMEKHKSEREHHRQAMDALRNKFEAQVKDLLTDEQKTEFTKFLKSHGPQSGQQKPKR